MYQGAGKYTLKFQGKLIQLGKGAKTTLWLLKLVSTPMTFTGWNSCKVFREGFPLLISGNVFVLKKWQCISSKWHIHDIFKYLTIIPQARMGYWLRGYEDKRNNCFSKIQLVIETKHLSQVKARYESFFTAETLQIWQALFATSGL